jgi:LuxR family transcriptional regulator, quorum-sensing system regulator SolR
MTPWKDDLLARMLRPQTERALFDELKAEVSRIGFDHCAYGLRLPLNLSTPKFVMFNTYPTSWQKRYASENYLATDPTVRHAHQSLLPLIWNNQTFNEAPEFWEDARSHGLRYGWSQPTMGIHCILGMLTLSRSGTPISEAEITGQGHHIAWLTQVVHQCMSHMVAKKSLPEILVFLSTREKDVLRWTAEGKTSGEISALMNISERTVNFHVANAMKKLNCVNKTAATLRAAIAGLLS